jgi:N-acetylglucosamine kinase-like BadF-type ATPase
MKYFIGIDGGGTKTKCVLTDSNHNILYECNGGPSNFLSIGTETVSKTITDLIISCISFQKISESDLAMIVLGSTGAGRDSDALNMEKDFLNFSRNSSLNIKSFKVVSDARIALEGAFPGKP